MEKGDHPTAQTVIDAVRFALVAQTDPGEALSVVKVILEYAPETVGDGGVELVMSMVAETVLKVTVIG